MLNFDLAVDVFSNFVYVNLMQFNDRKTIFLELGFEPSRLEALKAYIDFLWASNQDLNLISRQMSFEDLIENHLIDCLLPLRKFPTQVKAVADFGSGGGLPGVVYAIQFPAVQFHLFEKSQKKQNFLNQCKAFAPNLNIHGEIPKDLLGIDFVTARAFKPIDVILDMSRSYYQKGGKYFLLKGRLEKIEEEMVLARKKFKNLTSVIEPLNSPILKVERHLVLI